METESFFLLPLRKRNPFPGFDPLGLNKVIDHGMEELIAVM